MTVAEREEKVKRQKMAEIKKEEVEVEGINLVLNEVVKDSKWKGLRIQTGASNSQNHIQKAQSSDEENGLELGRAKKRTRITEESEEEKDESDKEPLQLAEEIVLKYYSFIDYLCERLKEEEKEEKLQWEKWVEILERGSHLVEGLNIRLKRVGSEMEWLKDVEGFEKEYLLRKTHLPRIFAKLRDINSHIVSSPHISLVSDTKNRGNVLSQCLDELESSKEELNEIMELIKVLNQLDMENGEDEATE